MDPIKDVRDYADALMEELAQKDAMRDRKVEAQRKEIVRQAAEIKALKAELAEALNNQKDSEWYRDKQRHLATINIQKKAIQERQDYIDRMVAAVGALLKDGSLFK